MLEPLHRFQGTQKARSGYSRPQDGPIKHKRNAKRKRHMDYSFTFILKELIHGLITLAMYEFIFRPWIFNSHEDPENKGKKNRSRKHIS